MSTRFTLVTKLNNEIKINLSNETTYLTLMKIVYPSWKQKFNGKTNTKKLF